MLTKSDTGKKDHRAMLDDPLLFEFNRSQTNGLRYIGPLLKSLEVVAVVRDRIQDRAVARRASSSSRRP